MKAIGMVPIIIWAIAILFLTALVNYSVLSRSRRSLLASRQALLDALPEPARPHLADRDALQAALSQHPEANAQAVLQAYAQYQQQQRAYASYLRSNPTRIVAQLFGFRMV